MTGLNIPALVRMQERNNWLNEAMAVKGNTFGPAGLLADPNRDMGHWGKRSPPPLVREPSRGGSKGKTGHEVALDGCDLGFHPNYRKKVWGY
jgi:hypothetical protein|tara:strand:+ start:7248 stop:7523 length:276 start_codon:yes stop_codon:yes gene_type:complete